MEVTLIDQFIVPEESKGAFLDKTRAIQRFLQALPGFVEGFVHEKIAGGSPYNVITTAVWESDAAVEHAKKTALAEFRRSGFDPQAFMQQLHVRGERAVFRRSKY